MTVENIGNIADAYSNGKLPKHGMIISATKEELMASNCNLLYREVAVVTTEKAKSVKGGVKGAPDAENLYKMFLAQIERCAAICNRIVDCGDRTYTPKEVLSIIDELLDGVKPKKSVLKKAVAETRKESEVRG